MEGDAEEISHSGSLQSRPVKGMLEVSEKAIRIVHEMRNDDTGDVAATMVIVGVHLDMASRKACSLPRDVRERGIFMINDGRSPIEAPAGRSTADPVVGHYAP